MKTILIILISFCSITVFGQMGCIDYSRRALVGTYDATPSNSQIDNGSGTWDGYTSSNWTFNGGLNNTTFLEGSKVIFGGANGTHGTITLDRNHLVEDITFANLGTGNTTISGAYSITNRSGNITVDRDATINSTIGGTNGFNKTGTGQLTLSANQTYSGASAFTGTLEITGNIEDLSYPTNWAIPSGSTFKFGSNNSGGYARSGWTLVGDGVGNTRFQVFTGLLCNMSATLTINTAPTTIDRYGGSATTYIRHFDVNSTSMNIASASSGTVIGSGLTIGNGGYGFRITCASGANNATGDLIINAPLSFTGTTNGYGLILNGTGSYNITSQSPSFNTNQNLAVGGLYIASSWSFTGETPTLMFTGTASLGNSSSWSGGVHVYTGASFIWKSSTNQTLSGLTTGDGLFEMNSASTTLTRSGTSTHTGTLRARLGTIANTVNVPNTNTWEVMISNSSPSVANSGLITLPASPALTGKTINIVITESGTGISYTAISWTGTATGTPTLKVNGITVTSGIANANGTTVTFNSTTGITVTR